MSSSQEEKEDRQANPNPSKKPKIDTPTMSSPSEKELEGALIGMCNPLLDISVNGVPQDFIDKYDIKLGTAILAEPKHAPLYDEMKSRFAVEYLAGGAGQNSIRAAQWLLRIPKVTKYIGCVGDDEFGRTLKQKAEENGVTTLYRVDKTAPTGTCAVVVQNKERALIANLAAANNYKKEDHFDTPEIQKAIEKARIFYCTGFFVSFETALATAKHASQHNKYFFFNLSAVFVIDVFWDRLNTLMPYVDGIFGNEDEWAAFGKKAGWGTDLKTVVTKVADMPKENKNHKRIVIATQGARNTLVFSEGKFHEFTPLKLSSSQIVDTNGAGDSFVGGFLAGFLLGKPLDECVRAAHYIASECVQRSGATFPPSPKFEWQK